MTLMSIADVDKLLSFLRLDKSRMELEKVAVTSNDNGLQVVELAYIDTQTKELKRCVIGINGAKINEFASTR